MFKHIITNHNFDWHEKLITEIEEKIKAELYQLQGPSTAKKMIMALDELCDLRSIKRVKELLDLFSKTRDECEEREKEYIELKRLFQNQTTHSCFDNNQTQAVSFFSNNNQTQVINKTMSFLTKNVQNTSDIFLSIKNYISDHINSSSFILIIILLFLLAILILSFYLYCKCHKKKRYIKVLNDM